MHSIPADLDEKRDAKDVETGDAIIVESKTLEVQVLSDTTSHPPSELEPNAFQKFTAQLSKWGVETHGIAPIPPEERKDTRLYQMFFIWCSANLNALTFYGAMIPSLLNAFSLQGFLILNTIVGGQTLAAVSDHLNDTLGIVIIGVVSLVITFCGYKVLHMYESVAWIPNLVAFLVMIGVGAKHIETIPTPPPEPVSVLSFASVLVSSVLSWCTMTPDYGVYHRDSPSWRIFLYVYLGFFVSSLPGHMLGASFAASAPAVPAWQAGLGDGSNVGGLIEAVLSMSGGFGKFLTVVIALTIPSAVAPTMYSFGTSFMAVTPILAKVPRYVYAVIATAILIPVAIVGAVRFYNTLVDILSIIGYWSAIHAAIIMSDHSIVRRGRFTSYNVKDWDKPRRLPLSLASVIAFLGAIAIIVPCMSQVWYIGPIASMGTGDISMFTGFAMAALLYVPLRIMEKLLEGNLGRGVDASY
ncbi:hypothetical protein EW146_g7213 [Bondarzewia mesenterica]|uniref:Cytosine-purine permease n=1 Tax=Bondarzewia mesenterica TaxID=1095465 RepID=A0A4S4LS28_9AGAM|nr:hypothetical protein EW146_g7213 [Bondarzewia mesenterica]